MFTKSKLTPAHHNLKNKKLRKQCALKHCTVCVCTVRCVHPICQKIVNMNDYEILIHVAYQKSGLYLEKQKSWKTEQNVHCTECVCAVRNQFVINSV